MDKPFGPDHPWTLENRSRLAWWNGAAGDQRGAVATIENLLADCLRVLGPDHPSTLSAHKNLAHWQAKAADPATRTQSARLTIKFGTESTPFHLQGRCVIHNWPSAAGQAAPTAVCGALCVHRSQSFGDRLGDRPSTVAPSRLLHVEPLRQQ